MKHTNLFIVLVIFIGAQVLYSCSSSSGFAKRKYFNFRQDKKEYVRADHGKNTAAGNAANTEAVKNDEAVTVIPSGEKASEETASQETASKPAVKKVQEMAAAPVDKAPASSISEERLSFGEKIIVKQAQKIARKNQQEHGSEINTLLLVIIAILLPPLAVFLVTGLETEFWISLLLTLLFYVPGLIYALYIIFTRN